MIEEEKRVCGDCRHLVEHSEAHGKCIRVLPGVPAVIMSKRAVRPCFERKDAK